MTEITEVPAEGGEEVVFSASDYAEPEVPVKEETASVPDEKKEAEPKSFLENKKTALIIGVVGFIVIVIVFGFLFSLIDWDLIINPTVNP